MCDRLRHDSDANGKYDEYLPSEHTTSDNISIAGSADLDLECNDEQKDSLSLVPLEHLVCICKTGG